MKFDNRKNMYRVWLRKFFFTALLLILIIVIGFSEYFLKPVLGLDKSVYLIALGIIYIVLIIINALLKPDFVFYGDVGDKIILRYYPIRILNAKKHSIEIPKSKLARYETEKYFFGKKERIFLYQRTQNGIARYPGINLSAVDKNDIRKIKRALDQYIRFNQRS
jgi:hypothetical protein